jgi:hypothetical protein
MVSNRLSVGMATGKLPTDLVQQPTTTMRFDFAGSGLWFGASIRWGPRV